jgi:arylformamidase
MRIIDISLPIGRDLLAWPGNPPVEVVPHERIADGKAANVSQLRLGTHTGTHVDPPIHFIEGGVGIDAVSLDTLIGPCVVADARRLPGELGPEQLDALDLPTGVVRVLFRTDNSALWRTPRTLFPDAYTSLSEEGAQWLIGRGIRLVGTDFLSIEARGALGHPTHVTLLDAGVSIVEGLDLGEVEPGRYLLVALPLRIVGGDGGPARAALIDMEGA